MENKDRIIRAQQLLYQDRPATGVTDARESILDNGTSYSILGSGASDLTCLPRSAGERRIYNAWYALEIANGKIIAVASAFLC